MKTIHELIHNLKADDDDQGYTLSIQAKREGGTNYDQRQGGPDSVQSSHEGGP